MKIITLGLFLLFSMTLAGCGSTGNLQNQESHEVTSEDQGFAAKDSALSKFIQGSLFETRGDYASAILEYQEALQYEKNAAILYALSRSYSAIGKHSFAAMHGKEAVELEPKNLDFRKNLANVYLHAMDLQGAVRQFEEIVTIDSMDNQSWFALARLIQSSAPLRALSIYERILQYEGERWEILSEMATVNMTLNRLDPAARALRKMLDIDPGNRGLQRQLAQLYLRIGRQNEALGILEPAYEEDPKDIETGAMLADLSMERGEYVKALELYKSLRSIAGDNLELKMRIAIAYFGIQQRDSSVTPTTIELLNELSTEAASDWRPHWYLGAIAATSMQDSLALIHFQRVTELAAWNADAWYYVGSLRIQNSEYIPAIEQLEKARTLHPNDVRFAFLLGVAYDQTKEEEKAIELFRQGLKLSPNDISILTSYALTMNRLERFAESDSLYERVLGIDPENHLALNNYAYTLAERDLQLDRALSMAQQAVAAQPKNSSYLDTIGWVYYMLGNYTEAEKWILKSIETGDASAVIYDHMGDVYEKLGQSEKATEYWRKALEKDSSNESIRKKLE